MITHIGLKTTVQGEQPFNSFSSFILSQSIDWHHTFELRVPLDTVSGGTSTVLKKSKAFVGKAVSFEFISSADGKGLSQFNGIITELQVHRGGGISGDLVIKGYSPTIVLDQGTNTKFFVDKTLSAIVQDITSKYPRNGFNYTINPKPNPKHDFIMQYQESGYNFINRMANRYGHWFFYNGKDCYFGPLPNETKTELNLGSDLTDFRLGVKLVPSKFKTTGYDYVANKVYETGPASVNDLDDLGKFALQESESYFFDEQLRHSRFVAKAAGDIHDVALARRSSIAANMVGVSGTSTNAQLKIGLPVSIKASATQGSANDEDFGTFIISRLTHRLDSGGHYYNSFEALPHTLKVPPPNKMALEPACETQAAKIYKVDDPDKHGRVKVKFYWQDDSAGSTPWIRVLSPHAGKNRGFNFLPEVGDEVLVSFENNNPDRPIVIGSLYHGKADHSDRADKDNYIKTIRTISGNEIKFTDKKGEEEIEIMNKNGDNKIILSLKDSGKITIQSKGAIDLKAQEINIEAQKDVTIKGKNIHTEATEKVNIKGKKAVEVQATDIKIASDANTDIEAKAKVSVKAQAGLNMDGGTMAELKANGAMNVTSSGVTNIKGMFVAIN